MKFEFKGTAREFDEAAEQRILLNYVSGRKHKRNSSFMIVGVITVLSLVMIKLGLRELKEMAAIYFLCILAVAIEYALYERSKGNMKSMLEMLYRGRHPNHPMGNKTLIVRAENETILICNEEGRSKNWDLSDLRLVKESDEIFELRTGRTFKRYLALPKALLKEGTVEDFRSFLLAHCKGKQEIERYKIPAKLQNKLAATKKELFESTGDPRRKSKLLK